MTTKKILFGATSFADRVRYGESMAVHTTLGVGGEADYFIEAKTSEELIELIVLSRDAGVEFTVLGSGSNVLIADTGYRGLIICNRASSWHIVTPNAVSFAPAITTETTSSSPQNSYSRWNLIQQKESTLGYDENEYPVTLVRADSGALLQRLMLELFAAGITGLEWFAGIPATVGGAIFMNLHGGQRFFGDVVVQARLLDPAGTIRNEPQTYFRFAYDWSILHDSGEIVIDAILKLRRGPVELARTMMLRWMAQKNRVQPKRSSGCIFQNLSKAEQIKLNLPTTSAGYFIDVCLKLKGFRIGGAMISMEHGNFMVNAGRASADDFIKLISEVKHRANQMFGLTLKEEVRYLGFSKVK